jgi:restriction system protein
MKADPGGGPSPAHLGDVVGRSILIAWSNLLQYVLPALLLALAAIGALRSVGASRIWREAHPPVLSHDSASEAQRAAPDGSRWSLELLRALEWKRFEQVCAAYFETLGFRCKIAGEGADGGVDIRLFVDDGAAPVIIAQCKSWNVRQVGVKPIRELFGVMSADGVEEGIFVTTGTYTADAREFAQDKNMSLIDGADLLQKIAAASVEDQQRLLKLATSGDFTTPTCPSCGIKMVERRSGQPGARLWGCPRFPRCRTMLKKSVADSTAKAAALLHGLPTP